MADGFRIITDLGELNIGENYLINTNLWIQPFWSLYLGMKG
jgi:hypothetical protein